MDKKRGYSWETAKIMLSKSLGCSEEVAEEMLEKMEEEYERGTLSVAK